MPINQVTGIASQLLIKAIQQKLTLQGFPEMQLGETLEAQVAQKLDGNKVVVMIKGTQVMADTTIPLQIGQKLNVQVETLKPQIMLRLATGAAGGEQTQITGYLKAFPGDPQAAAVLQLGETLQAQVSQKLDGDKVVVTMKGVQVTADTPMPLQVGQKINVQVESLQPQILLRLITADAGGEQTKITGYLKAFRSNPQAMAELFQSGGPLFSPESLKTISHSLLRDRSQVLGQMIRTLIFSTETMNNPSFIRDFVARSGLLLEYNLGKALGENPAGEVKIQPQQGDNLKSALIKFGAEIREWLASGPNLPEAEMTKLLRLADYADRSVHSLETQQVLNVVSREQDNRFMVQIPFAFPQSLTMQDIFIEFDGRRGEEKEAGSPFRVVFFLNLDALGEMMIDVGIRGQDLSADLSCQSVDTMTFVSASLEELKKNLDSLGFRVVRMTCDVRDDIGPAKNDYVRNSSLYEGDVINFFV